MKTKLILAEYCVDRTPQENGDHEVHRFDCEYLPNAENRQNLGDFSNCRAAVRKAKKYYAQSNGCFYCSYECHKI